MSFGPRIPQDQSAYMPASARHLNSRVWKRCLLEKGSFQKSPFSRDSRDSREFRDSREPPPVPGTVESKGESDHLLEILDNLEILENLEIPPFTETPFRDDPFSVPETRAEMNGDAFAMKAPTPKQCSKSCHPERDTACQRKCS